MKESEVYPPYRSAFREIDLGVMSPLNKDDITVVIPVLNEEEGIGQVINATREEGYHNILVIDGYSTDETVAVASKNGVRVIYQNGIGKTGAISTAIEHVDTNYLVVMDGDCTYDPKDIKNFFPHLFLNDEVIGVRTFGRGNIPIMNRFGNWVLNTTFNMLFSTNLVDVCTGLYALKSDFAKTLELKSRGFDVEVEVAAQAASHGKIAQVPIHYRERVGKQKLRPFKHGFQIFTTIWNLARIYNPVLLFSALAALNIFPAIAILLWVVSEWLKGTYHSGLALFGVLLFIVAMMALSISTISTLLRRMEQRLLNIIKNEHTV